MSDHGYMEDFKRKFKIDDLEIAQSEGWILSLRPNQITLGSMVISSSEGFLNYSSIGEESYRGFFKMLSMAEEVSDKVFGSKRVNSISLMMKDPIIHYHIIPRYPSPVQFSGREWIDESWPAPPNFKEGETDSTILNEILNAISAFIGKNHAVKKLKNWMAQTLSHYEYCEKIFYQEFGDHLYAVGGTLLGGIRDRGFISHDKDMDVAYLSGHRKIKDVKSEFLERIIHLLDMGERVTIVDRAGRIQRRHAKWWARDGSYVDLFPACYDESGFYSRPTFVRIALPKEDLLPLRQVQFEGSSIYVPQNTTRKFQALFGDNWEHPDPSWTKPVFEGVEEMRKAFAFGWKEVKRVAMHSRYADRIVLEKISKKAEERIQSNQIK